MEEREDLPMIIVPEEGVASPPPMVKLPARLAPLVSRAFGKPSVPRPAMPTPPVVRAVPRAIAPVPMKTEKPKTSRKMAQAPAAETAARRSDEQRIMLQEALQANARLTQEREQLRVRVEEAEEGARELQEKFDAAVMDRETAEKEAVELRGRVSALEAQTRQALDRLRMSEASRKRAETERADYEGRLAAAWVALQPPRRTVPVAPPAIPKTKRLNRESPRPPR